jgi:uracil-DNA glycosylase family 4
MQPHSSENTPCQIPPTDRSSEMAALRVEALQRGLQVFGEGNLEARLMLVGEAPGKEEAETGRPFVGPAGTVLNRLLDCLSIPRSELWITNVVKIRPVRGGCRNQVNRPPQVSEIIRDRDILEAEISIICPKVILCLGAVPASTLIHPGFRMRDERGCWFPGPHGSRLMATYHPAYLLRLRGPDYEAARDAMLADLARAWGEVQRSPSP